MIVLSPPLPSGDNAGGPGEEAAFEEDEVGEVEDEEFALV